VRRRALISLFSSVVAWPVAAQMQSTAPPSEAMTSSLEKIVMVRVKRIDPASRRPWFRLSDGQVDLMKVFSLGGSEGIGGTWKMVAPTDQTFDARYGRW
jgi:hypothetical protein